MDLKPSAALGPLSDWTVPQYYFSHFYAVGALWNALVAALFFTSTAQTALSPPARTVCLTALALLEVHLVRRFLETVFLMKYPPGARMHGVAYLFGLSYYLAVPVTVVPAGVYAGMAASLQADGVIGPLGSLWGRLSGVELPGLNAVQWTVRTHARPMRPCHYVS